MRRQRCRKQRVADAAEHVAVGIRRLHEYRVGSALVRRLDRMVTQLQLVQDVGKAYLSPGSLGNDRRASARGTSVPAARDGKRLSGGAVPYSTHSNSATRSARMNAP